MSNVQSITCIGDVENFANVTTITHDSDYVQVTIAPPFGQSRTWSKLIPTRATSTPKAVAGELLARHIEEAAALVSTPALEAWLADSGFTLNA